MFHFFERSLKPTAVPESAEPPAGLVAFYWHFARQAKPLFIGLFAVGFAVALIEVMIPVFIGKVVTLVTASKPEELLATAWPWLLGMAGVLLVLRPLASTSQHLLMNQAIAANVSNRIRWQNHWHVSRQSWAFFQNDFAGRIATRVMQTGPAIRESLVSLLTAVWFILIYGTSSLILLASADRWLALPVLLWFAGYMIMLRIFVPRMRDKSKVMSETRSMLTGRIVDTYTNIVTVKLFARAKDEDGYVREAIDQHTGRFHELLRLNTLFALTLTLLNSMLVTSTGAFAIVLWRYGYVGVGTVAMALPMTMQIISASGWVAWQITDIFENIGVVQEGMLTIARPHTLVDRPDARALTVTRGEIRFENIRFGYGRESGLIDGLTLDVRPGEKIGAGRPLRRRQVDARQPAAAFLRSRRRPYPHRRAGYLRRLAGKPARPHLDGDTGHLAAAPLDPRQYPIRLSRCERGRDRCGRGDGACARIHRRARGLEGPARL